MKKILVGIATFITMATLCVVSAGAETYGDYEYTVLDDGTVEITDYTGSAATLEIPSELDGKSVTSIGDEAFKSCYSLNSVIIPDGITNIGDNAFYACVPLTSINIPGSVNSIGDYAFYDCKYLTSITIPYGVESIGDYTFSRCFGLKSIILSDSITSIGDHAFYNCTGLTSVDIPKSVTSIGEWTFASCSSLSSVTIPNGVSSIGENAFIYCTSLAEITIPNSVTEIGGYAFHSCSKLQSVIIPDGVTSIGKYAFYECTDLTFVFVPDSVKNIENYALGYYDVDRKFTIVDGFVICCNKGSVAYEYAINNGIEYKQYVLPITDFALKSRNYNSITLSWAENEAASGYIIQQLKNNVWVNAANIKDSKVTSYQITNLAANTSYKFRAVAYITDEESTTFSNYTSAMTISTAPAQTQGFAITGRGSDFLTITWTKNAGASGYIIQEQIDGIWKNIASIKGNATVSYKIENLQPNSFHRYRMVAYKTDDNGTCYGKYTGSAPGYTAPAMVTGLAGISTSATSIAVSWNKVTSANGYVIDVYKDGRWSQLIKLDDPDITSYTVSELTEGVQYKFRIKSYATNGTLTIYSTYSSAIAITSEAFGIENLRMTNRGTDFISVRWDKNEAAEGYMVYIYDGSKWTCVKTLTNSSSVSHKITELESGKAYKVTVKAYRNFQGTKFVSDTATITANTL
ncbi:MAG: leucine-rich repeat protein [Ruminiclostridium sp.]|nr:leucine-rich repeat protein [Ruminiclostridium sp.]